MVMLLSNSEYVYAKTNINQQNHLECVQENSKEIYESRLPKIESKIRDGIIMTREEFEVYMASKNQNMGTNSVPKDGYIYVFDDLYITNNIRVDNFRQLGEYLHINDLDYSTTATYYQEQSTSVEWDVAVAISGNAKIGNRFLGEIETTAGISVARKSTVRAGQTFGLSVVCPAHSKLRLSAYQGGIYATATMVYSKYHSSGASAGKYTETVSGTVLKNNSYSIKAEKAH